MRAHVKWRLGLFLLVAICNVPIQAVNEDLVLSKGRAGPVRTGMKVDDLYTKVGRNSTKLVDQYSEGFFSPAIEIYSGQDGKGRLSLVAGIAVRDSNFVIGWISVRDSRFKTDSGIGVGSTLGEIRHTYKVDWIAFGEGPLFARVEQIGMSFALDYSNPSAEWRKTGNQALIPDSAKVVFILLVDGTRPDNKP